MYEDINIVFVYGTLKKGFPANKYLSNSSFIGTANSTEEYSIYANYMFPAMLEIPSKLGVFGELYIIDPDDRKKVDEYEGVAFNLYELKQINLSKISLSENYLHLESCIKSNELPVKAYIYRGNLREFVKIDFWP